MTTEAKYLTPKSEYIVSHDHKFLYFWVRKVGCTSIKTALLPLFDLGTPGHENDVHELFARSNHQIEKPQLVAKLGGGYRNYFKFAFVRNPWDRLVSCYCNKLGKNGPGLKIPGRPGMELYPGTPFDEFVEVVCATPDTEANAHFRSQYKTICAPGKDKPILADFVGRFENLAEHFEVVTERIGAAQKLQLPHKKHSRSREGRSYTDFYDERLKNLVYERYQEDIEIFNYSFGDSHILPPLWQQDPEGALASLDIEMATENWLLQQRVEELKRNLAGERREARQLKRRLIKLQSSRSWRLLNKLGRVRAMVLGRGR